MLKLNRLLLAADVNTGGESSTSPDVKGTESSTVENEVVNETEEVEADVAETETESTETTTEETAEETQQVEGEEQVTEVEPEKPKHEEAIPYERFNEVNSKKTELEQQIAASQPLVEQARVTNQFLQDNQIAPQEYQTALKYLQLLRTDPQQAYAMIKPTFERLALLTGDRLTPELQAEVAAGTISPERAQQISRAEAQQQYNQWRGQQQQQVQQGSVTEVVNGTIGMWAQTKQTVDLEFKPGTPLWNQVDLRLKAMPPFRNAQEAMAGSEKAYAEAKTFMQTLVPRPAKQVVKSPMRGKNNGSNNNLVMKTAEDVTRAIAAGIKPNQMRY